MESSSLPIAGNASATRPIRWSLLLTMGPVALAGFAISGYMAWTSLTGSTVAGCDGGVFDCGHVLTSRWSKVLGIPVGFPAMGVYLVALAAIAKLGLSPSDSPKPSIAPDASTAASDRPVTNDGSPAWTLLSLLAWSAALAAVWFTGLQIFEIGHLCVYCLAAHTCGLLFLGLTLWFGARRGAGTWKTPVVALLGVGAMVLTQTFTEPPPTFRIESNEPVIAPASTSQPPPGTSIEKTEFSPPGELEMEFAPPAEFAPPGEFAPPVFESPEFESPEFESPSTDAVSAQSPSLQSLLASPLMTLVGVMMAPDEATTQSPEQVDAPEPRLVPVSGGRRQLDVEKWPRWGDRDSKYVFVKMFDYTCSHCRETHHAIEEANQILGGELAVVTLPVPLHQACNDASKTSDPALVGRCEIAKIAVAAWIADPSKFTEFHNWMFEQERTADEAAQKARLLMGAERFDQVRSSDVPASYVSKHVFLYKEASAGTLPKLIFPTTTIIGEIGSGTTLAGLIKEKLR